MSDAETTPNSRPLQTTAIMLDWLQEKLKPGESGEASLTIGDKNYTVKLTKPEAGLAYLIREPEPVEPTHSILQDRLDKGECVKQEKPSLTGLVRDDPRTPEGKYLVKRRDGTVPEWPSFVLGARDPYAAVALRAYAEAAYNATHNDQWTQALLRLAAEFDAYRKEHGDGDPDKGIHRKDDPATVAEMRKGQSA